MERTNDTSYDYSSTKKVFSRIGVALSVMLLTATVVQVLLLLGCKWLLGDDHWLLTSSWGMWLDSFVPIYLIAVPIGLIMLRRCPAEVPQSSALGAKNFWIFVLMSFPILYGGNIIGTVLSLLLSGGMAENPLTDYAMDNHPLKMVVVVILAPLIEEYIFRKQLVDRTRKYGEKQAVLLSGLTFGLFHLNLFQFFYAFGLGLLFAYVYIRTGRLRYTVLLHSIVNFMGSVVGPLVLSLVDLEALENIDPNATTQQLIEQYGGMLSGMVVYLLYTLLLLGLAVAGLVFLIIKCRKLIWKESDLQLPKGHAAKTAYLNAGMIIYILLCLSLIVISLF